MSEMRGQHVRYLAETDTSRKICSFGLHMELAALSLFLKIVFKTNPEICTVRHFALSAIILHSTLCTTRIGHEYLVQPFKIVN
jgi:hypothetical protein